MQPCEQKVVPWKGISSRTPAAAPPVALSCMHNNTGHMGRELCKSPALAALSRHPKSCKLVLARACLKAGMHSRRLQLSTTAGPITKRPCIHAHDPMEQNPPIPKPGPFPCAAHFTETSRSYPSTTDQGSQLGRHLRGYRRLLGHSQQPPIDNEVSQVYMGAKCFHGKRPVPSSSPGSGILSLSLSLLLIAFLSFLP